MYGLYIHIPFCIQKCLYCDFNSYANKLHLAEPYVDALLKEAELSVSNCQHPISTIYIGGGTPTCLSDELINRLLNGINKLFAIQNDAEITIEANPGTLSPALLQSIKSAGVNRLSIGAQSLNNHLLKTLGRIHTAEDFFDSVAMAQAARFDNISADMMFALPTQALTDWTYDIQTVSKLGLSHLSCYSLKIEEGTPFYLQNISPASDELDREMYHAAVEILQDKGYNRYEISNFARDGKQSRHNLKYWLCEHYIGLGAGAHSFMDSKRYSNVKSVEEYINLVSKGTSPVAEQTELTQTDLLSEKIFLGLRLDAGVSIELISQYTNSAQILEKLFKQGLIIIDNNTVRLTEKGIDLSNQVFMEFI